MLAGCLWAGLMATAAQGLGVTRHISSADGLSNDFVVAQSIDGMGYLWVGTESGVNRIAGNTCRPMFAEQLEGSLITALHWHAASGHMLIGTERGLLAFRPETGDVRWLSSKDGLVMSSINDIAEASDGGVWLVYGNGPIQHLDCSTMAVRNLSLTHPHGNRCAMDDGQGRLLIGHSQHGLTVVNIGNSLSTNYRQQSEGTNALPGNNVRCIYRDRAGRIWIGTDTGLALFDCQAGTFAKVTETPDAYDDNVYDICQMKDGSLWVATDIGGIKVVGNPHPAPDGGLHYAKVAVSASSLNTRSIVEDEYGNVWVGNHSTGVDFISGSPHDFRLLGHTDTGQRQPSACAIAADPQQGLWMASESELTWWQHDGMKGRWSYLNRMRREYAFPRCLMADSQGGVWLGIDDQGVYRFDKQSRQFAHIAVQPEGSDIHCFAEDSQGRVWIGGEFGVYCYADGRVMCHDLISRTLRAPATCIMEMPAGRLFVATLGDGVYSFDMSDGTFRHLNLNEGLPSSKVNHTILSPTGELWLATDGGLVCLKDPVGLTGVSVYGRSHGLTDTHILALQQDGKGNVWASTYAGISCFVKASRRFYNYSQQDTRLPGGFVKGAAMTDAGGTMYFGSVAGICVFSPQQMADRQQLSDIQIISCEAYNPVGSSTEIRFLTPDGQGRVYTDYRQNTIRLLFCMRDFAQASAVDYAYMMKGMDGKWYEIGNDHNVVFRGLRPGEYTFILRAKLRSQDWEQARETQLTIIIAPPFWRTWWAYLLYLLAAAAVAYCVARAYQRRLVRRNARDMEHRESQQKQRLNEERLRFFTNITHELRTPLTLILGPIDDLMADTQLSAQNRKRVGLIQKSAERLRSLINELLEFRKIETQNRRLTVARGDIGRFVSEIWLNHKELNRNPKVQYVCHIAEGLPAIWFDSEVITTIVTNFLSNASKYTEQGTIATSVTAADGRLLITVSDTGCGIAKDALPHVFDRYYQANGSHQASGTGIGLALVKSLVDLHEGTVTVESTVGQGSTFTVALDIDNTYPNALHKEDADESRTSPDDASAADGPSQSDAATDKVEPPLLLVVEDNADIRQYIADSFSDDFRILQAENGEEGVRQAAEHVPDIIVSDIMMPRMNGIELTRRLKSDLRTSHIPIVLLTAKTTDEDKEEGYDSGADSYLVKPFTAKLLGSRIRNLLTARRRLAEHIAQHAAAVSCAPQEAPATAADIPQLSRLDQQFLDKLNGIIRDNIMTQNIDMPFITDKMAMSHSTFYRKVKALTGMTATEYVRKLRLQYCYRLLESGDYNVNQAAMMTGFNQMAHFRETFRKEFGILPSEVKKK